MQDKRSLPAVGDPVVLPAMCAVLSLSICRAVFQVKVIVGVQSCSSVLSFMDTESNEGGSTSLMVVGVNTVLASESGVMFPAVSAGKPCAANATRRGASRRMGCVSIVHEVAELTEGNAASTRMVSRPVVSQRRILL